jgi:hypothetical protein
MPLKHQAALAALVLTLAGCSGSHGSGNAQQSTQQAPATQGVASTAPSSETAAAPAAPANLPVYPGATKSRSQMKTAMKICGSSVSLTMYEIRGTDAAPIAKWYDSRIPNAIHININNPKSESSSTTETNYAIFEPDGSAGVMVLQMHFASPTLANAAKSIGADKTTIGINSYNPPLSPDLMAQMQQGANGDAAAKAAARAQIKAKCGDTFSGG